MNHPERTLQKQIFSWAKLAAGKYPCLRFMHGSMVGTNLSIQQAVMNKAMGVRSGFPDITLPFPNSSSHGLYIELKIKPNKTTLEQREYHAYLEEMGYTVFVIYDFETAIKVIEEYVRG